MQLLFYQCMFLMYTDVTDTIKTVQVFHIFFHCLVVPDLLDFGTLLKQMLLSSLNQNQLLRYVVIMSFFSFGSHFTASLVLLVDPLWVHSALECSLGELIQG